MLDAPPVVLQQVHQGDALSFLRILPSSCVHCCVTSPPYWGLRDYGASGQLGLEKTPEEYVANMVEVFREVRRVLRDDGTLWLNLGDCYATRWGSKRSEGGAGLRDNDRKRSGAVCTGFKEKDLVGIPWRVAFALQADGWYLRSDIIWHKPNVMPESVVDRPTKSHEYLFLLSKSKKYYYDHKAVLEDGVSVHGSGNGFKRSARLSYKDANGACGNDKPRVPTSQRVSDSNNQTHVPGTPDHGGLHRAGTDREPNTRNRRTVWSIPTSPYRGAHFATFPPALVEPCILAACPAGGVVIDPFAGSGTTLAVAKRLGRRAVGIELNSEYIKMAEERIANEPQPEPFHA
jgi:site-specific DNA-methyltransferase (adenine-specific)